MDKMRKEIVNGLNLKPIKINEDASAFLRKFEEFGIYTFSTEAGANHIWFRKNGRNSYTIDHESVGYIGVDYFEAKSYIYRNRKAINSWIRGAFPNGDIYKTVESETKIA